MSKVLGKTSPLNFAAARKTVRVQVPELDEFGVTEIILRELSVKQLGQMDNQDITKQLSLMIVDENGERIFTSDEDLRNLSEMSAKITTRLITAAAKLNGISQAAVDESIKNLLASPNSDSNTDSPVS